MARGGVRMMGVTRPSTDSMDETEAAEGLSDLAVLFEGGGEGGGGGGRLARV